MVPEPVSALELSSRLSVLKQVFICVPWVGVFICTLRREGQGHPGRLLPLLGLRELPTALTE